jgi:hypothetical protein
VTGLLGQYNGDCIEKLDLCDTFVLSLADFRKLGEGLNQVLVEAEVEKVISEHNHIITILCIEVLSKFLTIATE